MDRRNLLRSLFALGGAATVLAIPKSSEAASLFDELEKIDAKGPAIDADLPAEGAEDARWGPPAWGRRCTFGSTATAAAFASAAVLSLRAGRAAAGGPWTASAAASASAAEKKEPGAWRGALAFRPSSAAAG